MSRNNLPAKDRVGTSPSIASPEAPSPLPAPSLSSWTGFPGWVGGGRQEERQGLGEDFGGSGWSRSRGGL